jgi:hypothetical protein
LPEDDADPGSAEASKPMTVAPALAQLPGEELHHDRMVIVKVS